MHLHERDDEASDLSTLFRHPSDAISNAFRHNEMPLCYFITLTAQLTRLHSEDEFYFNVHYFHSFLHTIWAEGNIARTLQLACVEINACLEQYEERESGFALVAIKKCSITVERFVPQTVGCQTFSLSKKLANKQCI